MRIVSDKHRREYQNTHAVFKNVLFSKNHAVYEIMYKNRVQSDRLQIKVQYVHMHCMQDN